MKWIWIVSLSLLLTACGTKEVNRPAVDTGSTESVDDSGAILVERQEGDFIYRLVSETKTYTAEEEVLKIWAELEYVGDEDEVKIGHAASPFYFEVIEETHDITMGMAMNEPLIYTTIKKGEPLVGTYQKTGGWSEHTGEEEVSFKKLYLNSNGLPEGKYTFQGWAEFFVEDGDQYNIDAVELVIFSESINGN